MEHQKTLFLNKFCIFREYVTEIPEKKNSEKMSEGFF